MLIFKPTFSLSFNFFKKLFSSSSLSAIKVVSSAYLSLLIFLLAILIPACVSSRKQQLELDMEQQTGSKQEKEYGKSVYCHLAYLTSMQSTSWVHHARLDEAQAGIKIAGRNINNLKYTDDTTLMAESE